MLTIKRTGSVAEAIAAVRDVPARVVPYAASTALTRTAKHAQKLIVVEMPKVFDRPVRYTLNSLFTVPATAKTLAARVAVKNVTTNNGTLPQDYLLPSVLGGGRKEKRFERALRFAGVLQRGQRVVPGRDMPLDAAGNVTRAHINSILAAAKAAVGERHAKGGKRVPQLGGKGSKYFVMRTRSGVPLGVFSREGRDVSSVLAFVAERPQYRERLDFDAIAERAAREHFEPEFRSALDDLLRRGPR